MPIVFWQIPKPGYCKGHALHSEVSSMGPNKQPPSSAKMTKDSWNCIYQFLQPNNNLMRSKCWVTFTEVRTTLRASKAILGSTYSNRIRVQHEQDFWDHSWLDQNAWELEEQRFTAASAVVCVFWTWCFLLRSDWTLSSLLQSCYKPIGWFLIFTRINLGSRRGGKLTIPRLLKVSVW